jgi:hypothetical protein
MKKTFLTALVLCIVTFAFGQSPFKRNDIYLEAGGNGLWGSINYERQLAKEVGLGARIGFGFYTENAFFLTIPVGINYLFKLKKENSFIDAGLGVTWTRVDAKLFKDEGDSNGDHFVNFIPSVGYRKHTKDNMMFRFSLTPVINRNGLVPWIGASLGKRF